MSEFKGRSVCRGTAMGRVTVIRKDEPAVKRKKIDDPEAEIERFDAAREKASGLLSELHDKALSEVGEASAAIFSVHAMMLDDPDFLEAVRSMIRNESVNAEFAIAVTGDNFSDMFDKMPDDYMRARSADIKDIANGLVRILQNRSNGILTADEPRIIIADDLTPSETVRMDKSKILALVTVRGSVNSHTAILARSMNIPALVDVPLDLDELKDGTLAVVKGDEESIVFDPSKDEIIRAEAKMIEEKEHTALLSMLKGKESISKSGKKINIYANIGSVADLGYALENDAEGIGLLRSEFLYLEKDELPTEEEQFSVYKQVAQVMAGKKVVIRTLDLGADKKVDYLDLPDEKNPALGMRAIRIGLEKPEVLKTQLRAIFRAAKYGNVYVMYPFITSLEEIEDIKKISKEAEEELKNLGIPYTVPPQGIMIETPAAVMISDELAKEVDFFSIGTNDLTQYTLALDREINCLTRFYNPRHQAILRMIRITTENAHKNGIKVGICGELAADLSLTKEFLEMGIDGLSVTPSQILRLRETVRLTD